MRREWAEARIQDIKRNGRSELDIVGEGLDMYLKLAQELTKGAWPQVVNNAVVSGEVRQTLVGLADLLKDQTPTAEEDQIGPIQSCPGCCPTCTTARPGGFTSG